MTDCTWTAGEFPAAVTPRGVVVLEPGRVALAHEFWDELNGGADLGSLLQSLTSAFAADLASLPSFVAIIREGDAAHIAVRGIFELVVRTPEGSQSLTSGNVITWSEHRLPRVEGWQVDGPVDDLAQDPAEDPWCVINGIVPVRSIRWGTCTQPPRPGTQEPQAPARDAPPPEGTGPGPVPDPVPSPDPTDRGPAGIPPAADEDSPRAAGAPDPGLTWTESAAGLSLARADDAEAGAEVVLDALPAAVPVSAGQAADDGPGPQAAAAHAHVDPPDAAPPGVREPTGDFSDLFSDHTVHHAVEDAAVRHVRDDDEPDAGPTPVAAPPTGAADDFFVDAVPESGAPEVGEGVGDHDGHTVRSTRMDELQARAREIAGAPVGQDGPGGDGPRVLAVLCAAGHPNPTHASVCRTCGGPMSEQSVSILRPSLGSLVVSTGERIPLDRDVIVGRRPRYVPQAGRPEAHLVPVPSPNQQISRTHCEVRVDGWDVRVRDLGSNNGTFLLRVGQEPVRISESAPVIVRPGDVIDLGDSVTMRVEA